MLARLLYLIRIGSTEEVEKLVIDNPAFNINEDLDGIGWTALHFACSYGHHEMVSLLLAHLDINVNQRNNYGSTPFRLGCSNGKVEAVKVLLRDSRVDINMAEKDNRTPLWYASLNGYVEVIKWMIASGREIDLDKRGEWGDIECTATEIAMKINEIKTVSLLEKFNENQALVRHEIRLELGLVDKDAAELFAVTVFICDDYLRIKEPTSSDKTGLGAAIRFFNIVRGLPMELQMIICCYVYGSAKQNIKSSESEVAFRHLAEVFG